MLPTTASDAKPAVVRLHPIRSLVLASDAAYCERALAVIGDLGPVLLAMTAVHGCGDPADVLVLVRHENADVLVLDATGCEEGVERLIPVLAAELPRVGVVVVCEHSTTAAQRLGALPKWGWTQDLRRAVDRAYDDRGRRMARRRPAASPRAAGPLAGWD